MYMPNIAQGLSLEILLLVVMGFLWYKCSKDLRSKTLRSFFRLCSSMMAFLIVDVPVRLSDLSLVSWSPFTVYFLNALYIATETLTVYEWFDYFLIIQDADFFNTKFLKFVKTIPLDVMIILLFVSYRTGWLFYVNDEGAYTRGTMFFLQFAIPLVYLAASLVSTFLGYKKNKNRRVFRILLSVLIPVFIASTMQVLFSGSFTHLGLCIVIVIMYVEMFQEEIRQIDVEKKSNEAKSSFLARMSHDMRTPLNGILGLVEINNRNPENIELMAKNRVKIKAAANHLLSLINDVLDISKFENGKIELAHEPFSMSELMSDVATIVQAKAYGTDVKVFYENEDTKFVYPYTYGSPLHIRRILLNIIDNAIKYNKENGQVNIRLAHDDLNDGFINYKVVISDTGIGMSREYITKLFDPFSQEHIDDKSVNEGTGLGMTITKALVEKMGGTIDVDSVVGEGTTFTVSLNLEISETEKANDEKEDLNVRLDGINILLAEDNELNADIAVTLLEDFGAKTDLAVNGQEALDKFSSASEGTYDIILMDCMMPVLDGFEATKAIRTLERPDAKDIPIIAMTANAYAEDIKKCFDSGMNEHIAKPFDINKVVETVLAFIGTSNSKKP